MNWFWIFFCQFYILPGFYQKRIKGIFLSFKISFQESFSSIQEMNTWQLMFVIAMAIAVFAGFAGLSRTLELLGLSEPNEIIVLCSQRHHQLELAHSEILRRKNKSNQNCKQIIFPETAQIQSSLAEMRKQRQHAFWSLHNNISVECNLKLSK